ncbi:hypothetical protein J6590_010312 [Homalodisca vitripennis]|nr:hypothetical protein J6590_010312 [Homalodisca vitripennis]
MALAILTATLSVQTLLQKIAQERTIDKKGHLRKWPLLDATTKATKRRDWLGLCDVTTIAQRSPIQGAATLDLALYPLDCVIGKWSMEVILSLDLTSPPLVGITRAFQESHSESRYRGPRLPTAKAHKRLNGTVSESSVNYSASPRKPIIGPQVRVWILTGVCGIQVHTLTVAVESIKLLLFLMGVSGVLQTLTRFKVTWLRYFIRYRWSHSYGIRSSDLYARGVLLVFVSCGICYRISPFQHQNINFTLRTSGPGVPDMIFLSSYVPI